MRGVTLRRQQRHSHQPNAPQGSDAPVSLVFRTHGDSLSKAAFLFCPKNFNLANPVAAARQAPAASADTSAVSASVLASVPSVGSPIPPSSHHVSVTSPQLAMLHEGKRATAPTSSSASTESVQTLVEAIVELRPFSQPLPHSQGCSVGGGGGGQNTSGLAPVSPLVNSSADGATAARGLPGRTPSIQSVKNSSHADVAGLSSVMFPTSVGSFGSLGGGDGASVPLAQSLAASRSGEYSNPSAALARSGASIAANVGSFAQGGASGINASMLGNTSYSTSPISGVASPAGGAGSGGAGSGGGTSGGGGAAAAATGGSCFLMHPSGGWICRAMAFNEKEVSHANGAISVSQSLTSKCVLINEVAKGKVMARILSSYQDVQRRYGLSHVEVTVANQYLSRSDMFLISEALRERILYEGEETHICGFRIRVREMLQSVPQSVGKTSNSAVAPSVSSGVPTSSLCANVSFAGTAPVVMSSSVSGTSPAASAAGAAGTSAASVAGANTHVRVGCGIVLPNTRINFQSLSPVYYILLELSSEMWETAMDGRIALTLAIRKFLSELLLKQLPKRKASPLICVVFTGRIKKEFRFGRHSDVFHMLELPRELRNNVDIVEEIRMHCEALVQRVLREFQETARRNLEAECLAYREAATAFHSVSSETKSLRGRPGNDAEGQHIAQHPSRDTIMSETLPSAGSASPLPTTSETLKRSRASAVFPSAAVAVTEDTLDAYVQSRQRYIDSITVQQLFVHAKQSNTLEALSILLERCTHNYIDRNLTLCGHAVTVVSAGKGFYQVTNNLVQVVCARLHDIGLEKVHVVCIGRPPLHATPLLEYTSLDDTLRSQYHLHSYVPSGAAAGRRRTPGRVPATSVYPGEVKHYYETPEWMSVLFFNASLQNESGGETVFELLSKDCWERQHSVLAALKSLWPTLPQPQGQTRQQQQQQQQQLLLLLSQSCSVPALSSGGAVGDGGEEDGSSVPNADAAGGISGRGVAATALDSCGNPGLAAEETSLACCHAPLLIPGLGLRSYPVPEVTLPVHCHSPDTLLYAHGSGGGGAAGSQGIGVSPGGARGLTVAAADSGFLFGQSHVPVYPRSCTADLSSVSWTGSIGAERAISPSSPLGGARGKVAAASRFGPGAPFPTVAKCSSPLLVRSAMTSSKLFTSSAAALTQGSFPHGATGTCTLALQGTTSQQAQQHQGLKPTLPSHTVPISCSYSPLLQHAQYVQPVYTLNSAMFPGVGALGGGISGSETTPASVAAATVGGTLHLRRLRTGSSAVSGAGYRHLAAPDRSAGQRTRAMLVATPTVGSSHPRYPNSLPSSCANRCNPALQISLSFDHKTTANPEQHSVGAFEHSVRSVGSSLLCRDNSVPHQATKSLRCLDGSPKSSMNSIVTFMTAAAGADPGSSRRSGVHRSGGGLRPAQLRLEDGHVYRDVMALAVPCASCAWYCLHASKPHQENVGGAAAVSFSGSPAPTGASGALHMAARQGCGSGGIAAVCVSGGSSLFKTSAIDRGFAHREERSRTLTDDAPTPAPGESPRRDSSLPLPVRSWHKASSSTRSDAVFCGCNVVDSDLRSGYLILEITINAAVLPRLFWSPLLVLNDSYWAHLMSCFTGRDDRLTLDEELEFPTESDRNDDDMLTISGSSTDGLSLPLQASGGRGGRKGSDGGVPGSSLAAPATVLAGPKETSGGPHGGRESSGAGGVYHFQSVFRPTEVFCRSHSGITPDGRTLIIPTHSNSLHFQSPEELLLRVTPHLFVSAPDEGGDVSLGHLDPAVPGSPRYSSTSAVSKEAMEAKAKAPDVCMATRRFHSNLGGGGHECVAAAGLSTRRQRCVEGFGEGNEEAERVCSSSRMSVGGAAMSTPAAGSAVSETRAAGSPHPPDASVMLCNGETVRGNSTSNRDSLSVTKVKGATVGASPSLTPLSSSSRTVDAPGSSQVSSEASVPVTLNETLSAASSSTPQHGSSVSATFALPTAQSRPLRLPPVVTTTGTPVMPPGAQPLSFPQVTTIPVTPGGGLGGSSTPGPLPSSLTQDAAMQLAEQLPGFGTLCLDEVPLMPGTTVTVGFVQLRDSLLFAIKPINPLRQGSEEEQREDLTGLAQPAESVSTATVLRRRWQWKHPDVASELPNLASWTRLCTCRLLPLYGSKPAYPRESFYSVSPHQYTVTSPGGSQADAVEEKRRLLEFVLQRLQQQYQLVVDSPGLAAGSQWPRADLSPNARLEMSLGHQTHTLKLDETVKTISVTRMLHRGMYSNGQVTHMLSYRYLLWNYLADDFSVREVHMEAQVGERNAFRWEALDRWLQERPNAFIPRGLDVWLRSREVAVVLLPEDAAHPPSYEEFCRFIGYRFSVHLSTHGKVTWKPHGSPVLLDISGTTPLIFPAPPQLMEVVLVHDNPTALDTRNVIDRVTGRTVAFDVSVQERFMSVDISLPQQYHTRCCYFLRVSWLACAASIVMDWIGSFIANASRFHFRAVPVGCYYHSPKTESLTAHYDVEAASPEEEPALRRSLIELLLTPAYRYYADTPVLTRNCRLVHDSGLCYVIVPPSARTVAQWYQNALVRQGSVEQLGLLALFKDAVATARQRAAYIVTGDIMLDNVSSLTTEPL